MSRATVVNLLREYGYDPGPKRGEGTWDEFIRRHVQTLWACDFFTANAWTLQGLVPIFVFFFLHLGSRRVHVAGLTAHPNGAWMMQQARNVAMIFAEQPVKPRFLIRDLDSKFTAEFDDVLKDEGLDVIKVGTRKPNLNACAERWVRSIRRECLDQFVICGEAHLRYLVSTYVAYYNTCRPHQSLNNLPLDGRKPPVLPLPQPHAIVGDEQLDGLLKSYLSSEFSRTPTSDSLQVRAQPSFQDIAERVHSVAAPIKRPSDCASEFLNWTGTANGR